METRGRLASGADGGLDSFNTPFFVGLDEFPLAEEDESWRLETSFLRSELKCWRCGRAFGNRLTALKEHLEKEFEEWKREVVERGEKQEDGKEERENGKEKGLPEIGEPGKKELEEKRESEPEVPVEDGGDETE